MELYYKLGIPHHYDELLVMNGRQISPDFNGARADGTIIYHEHAGLHSDEYRVRDEQKRHNYADAGILPGVNLIYTYDDENGNLNMKLAEEQLKHYYKL